ncbi:hypothetical protein TTHERM_00439280 (macronuclear) [Tetrahymena thermophila SB210]|uniref:Uncharacterized protein n=1 Tax=Tetrahymena thermophila (strain SB210) TaxID=312017 RepID=I7M8B8_TETTS|nr:hypothetical protein TTHERM_00439280 [Tetrahymena thermophila SB210]EAR97580.1 hypothetical protein TTHERM_00439280 [Tetrahymena thermophila SB210]|eukprot:XP_001017825.1 hypothetical protein TTHERM_00439280 [Tetrahymena thermophila SB210]
MLNNNQQSKIGAQNLDQVDDNEGVSSKMIPQNRYKNMELGRQNGNQNQQGGMGEPNYNYPPMAQPYQDNFQPTLSQPQQILQVSNPSQQQQNAKTDLFINFDMPQMQIQDSNSNVPKSLEPSQPNQHRIIAIQDEENKLRSPNPNTYQNQVEQQNLGYQQQPPLPYNQYPAPLPQGQQPQMLMQNQNMYANQNGVNAYNGQNGYDPNDFAKMQQHGQQNNQYQMDPNPQMMNQNYQQGGYPQNVQQSNPYPYYPPPPMMNQPNNPYPPNPLAANPNQVRVEIKDLRQVPQTQSQSIEKRPYTRQQTRGKRKNTYVKRNTVSYAVATSTSNQVYLFIDTPGYHSNQCCCMMLYADDCCIKWMCDLLFQLIFLPFRIFNFIFKSVGSLCCKESCNLCVEGCQNCFYAPFRCYGDWMNQCWFACSNFCCQGIDFIPATFSSLYTNCCQKCCLQTGQCFKNCCVFNIDCNCKCLPDCPDCSDIFKNSNGDCCCFECCHDIGDCCFHLCSPQGCCEDMCKCCSKTTCDCINSDCIASTCSCCVSIKSVEIGEEIVKFFECCFCIFFKTIGAVIEGMLK